ncbi:MAG: ATP-binding protein [Flavobacterium sp.]|uniref:ATP-binding protein n=1 Tax=Flavobacterium sp. TaxID=239 RepID=UPI003263A7BF
MITIKIKKQYKSINLCEFELPDFSVLTGLNGSGKTHLLEAISNEEFSDVSVNGKKISNIRYIPFNGLNSIIQEDCDPTSITQWIKNFWTQLQNAIKRTTTSRAALVESNLYAYSGDASFKKIGPKIIPRIQKKIEEITENDIADNFDISMMAENDFFTAQFALIFKNYHRLLEENNINKYYVTQNLIPTSPILSDEEFNKKNGLPPWDFVNSILEEINVPYEVNSPLGTRTDSNFSFRLIDRKNGTEISSQDLSTGEKVLMSLALAIYNTKGDSNKPEFLLIDEPDAALHPSMSRKMVKILNYNIVTLSEIPAIITSHSPTTIISSEGISIYQMERGNPIPTKISVQKAVELLSSDIPFLKISNDQRRQVFVESKYDVTYYELITNILLRIDTINCEPIYLPARTSNGSNCTDVIEVVKNLFDNGNDQIYGIIDWDKENETKGRIIVLGENERYSIENYLLDPLMMGLLFIREAKISISDFALQNISSYSDLRDLTEIDAQKIIDYVLSTLNLMSANIVEYDLYNGWKLNVTNEFIVFQGHDLETLYKNKFPFLNVYQREDALKKDIIQKIINDFPQFTPNRIFETIKKII